MKVFLFATRGLGCSNNRKMLTLLNDKSKLRLFTTETKAPDFYITLLKRQTPTWTN